MKQIEDFQFGTKAETLEKLKPMVDSAIVLDLIYFSIVQWNAAVEEKLNQIQSRFSGQKIVIRSSAASEDGADTSLAGMYLSVLDVSADDREGVRDAVQRVVDSMPSKLRDQVIVQRMAKDITVSGVIMTFDAASGAPYYCIEFDDETGRTDSVTSGTGNHKSLYVYRGADDDYIESSRIEAFVDLASRLEEICCCTTLDIEFGMNSEGQLFLFQVRRLVLAKNWHPVIERRAKRQLMHAEEFLAAKSGRHDYLLGQRSIFAVMPDWNPAEIIGTTPRPLASSLYQTLVTDSVWAQARAVMGYRDLTDTPLMIILARHPYIDVRASFNSFLPADLESEIGAKLVDAWMARFETNPELHDKIEFEIVPTCIDFCVQRTFDQRYEKLLNDDEKRQYLGALTSVTRDALRPGEENTLSQAIRQVASIRALLNRPLTDPSPDAALARAFRLIDYCRASGTLPFAIGARHAFIAEALLRSAVERGALTAARFDAFKRTVSTVSGEMVAKYSAVCNGSLPKTEFYEEFGHLRPGTYEITSHRYDERGDFFADDGAEYKQPADETFQLTAAEEKAIEHLLSESHLDIVTPEALLEYASTAIAARENIKFEFTRLLSEALSLIEEWGLHYGLSRSDISHLAWNDIVAIRTEPPLDDLDRHFLEKADRARQNQQAAQTLKFAHIITQPRDIYVATLNRSVPNFIGEGAVTGKVTRLEANSPSNLDLADSIVCIENADPGFDWIFTKKPAALVTCFGGANSHMAVRCAELGIPAAIGCGDLLFDRIASTRNAEINCGQKILRPLSV